MPRPYCRRMPDEAKPEQPAAARATEPGAERAPPSRGMRKWLRREPLDELGQRTMFVGLIIAFAVYGSSFVVSAVYRDRPWANWASIVLILGSVVFLGVWFLMVRGGFRLGKAKSRAQRRAAMHAKKEREKRIRLNR